MASRVISKGRGRQTLEPPPLALQCLYRAGAADSQTLRTKPAYRLFRTRQRCSSEQQKQQPGRCRKLWICASAPRADSKGARSTFCSRAAGQAQRHHGGCRESFFFCRARLNKFDLKAYRGRPAMQGNECGSFGLCVLAWAYHQRGQWWQRHLACSLQRQQSAVQRGHPRNLALPSGVSSSATRPLAHSSQFGLFAGAAQHQHGQAAPPWGQVQGIGCGGLVRALQFQQPAFKACHAAPPTAACRAGRASMPLKCGCSKQTGACPCGCNGQLWLVGLVSVRRQFAAWPWARC